MPHNSPMQGHPFSGEGLIFDPQQIVGPLTSAYRSTSLIKGRHLLGPYRRPMAMTL